METVRRCGWVNPHNPLYIEYHDKEWGVPLHDDQRLFELLILESFQAGLSWECILNKRENFRAAFAGFDAAAVASFDEQRVEALMQDAGIVRNRRKITAAIRNSKIFPEIQKQYGSFDTYLWSFTEGKVVKEPYTLRTTSPPSDAVSKDLQRRGMRFVGSTIIYSYLQAVGVINGHAEDCDLKNGEK